MEDGIRVKIRWSVVAAVAIAMGIYYLWAVHASGTQFAWGYALDEYYDLLGRGFAGGHLYLPVQPSPELLAQPNPWDPAVDASIKRQDMVLFGSHYYLYFGAAPAVLLFTPFRLITGHDLPQGFAMFLLCLGGFLFSCGSLLRVLDLASTRPGPFLLTLMLLALGICQSVPYLLNRVDVYEVAIGGGYFCVSAAMFFFARGIRSRHGARWLAGCGLMLGLAVASRPHLFLAGVAAVPFLVAALFVPSWRHLIKHSKLAAPAETRTVLGVALCAAMAVLLFLMSTHLATHRYEVDFLPLAVFAAVANFGVRIGCSSGRGRVALGALFAILIGYSAIANLALGIAGPYDDILKNRPLDYVRIAHWFSPFRETRLVTNPEITVELTAEFIPQPPGFREPLITVGQTRHHHFLFVERGAGVLRLISQTDDSRMAYEMPDPGRQPVSIRLVYAPDPQSLSVWVNGEVVIAHHTGMLITAPALVAIGENFVDFGLTVRRFTGQLRLVDKIVGRPNQR